MAVGKVDDAEVEELRTLLREAYVLPHPTRDAVLSALREHAIAHFACHGHANWTNPAASWLVLYDSPDAPLTVADITALSLTASLAYLSACRTAFTSP